MIIGIIPARYDSTRLPGKMLAGIGGKPLLWHTWSRACKAERLDRVVIAAGDRKIADAARDFGAEVVEAFVDVPSGSDRVLAAYKRLQLFPGGSGLDIDDARASLRKDATRPSQEDIILNIQGDEPQIAPEAIDAAVSALLNDPAAGVGTVVAPVHSEEEYYDPTVVKVVLREDRRALYFSRSPIPSGAKFENGKPIGGSPLFRHMGLYSFRAVALERFASLPQSPLEISERLEQLRLLEAGVSVAVGIVSRAGLEVNTQEDLDRVRAAQ